MDRNPKMGTAGHGIKIRGNIFFQRLLAFSTELKLHLEVLCSFSVLEIYARIEQGWYSLKKERLKRVVIRALYS